jgi:hypothetical protein
VARVGGIESPWPTLDNRIPVGSIVAGPSALILTTTWIRRQVRDTIVIGGVSMPALLLATVARMVATPAG